MNDFVTFSLNAPYLARELPIEPPGTYSKKLFHKKPINRSLADINQAWCTYVLKKLGVYSKPRYCAMFGWSRSFKVSLSIFNACTTVTCRVLPLAVVGISTCFTAITSPVVAFKARYTRPYVPFPINSPRTHLKIA
jgi:hypothetical protein